MSMKMVLKSPSEAPYEAGKDFSVVIACADSSTAAPACEVLELIEESLLDEGRLFYQWWNFEVLTVTSLRELAAAEAAMADIIIIGLHEGKGLPQEVSDWMKQWLGLRKDRPGALVALLDSNLKTTDASQGILSHLKQVAAFSHMDFFATRAKEESESGVAQWASEAARQFVIARKHEAQSVLPGTSRTAGAKCGPKKKTNLRRLSMDAGSHIKPDLDHDEIARLACQIWQTEGCQNGRDQEYWLQAEQQLRAMVMRGNNQPMNAPVKRLDSSATEKRLTSQSAVPAGSDPSIPPSRATRRL